MRIEMCIIVLIYIYYPIIFIAAEKQLIGLIKMRTANQKIIDEQRRFFELYLKIGHINLLAEDYAKGLLNNN